MHADACFMMDALQMIDAVGIERGCPGLDAVNLATLFEKILGQISAILSSDTGNQSSLVHGDSFPSSKILTTGAGGRLNVSLCHYPRHFPTVARSFATPVGAGW